MIKLTNISKTYIKTINSKISMKNVIKYLIDNGKCKCMLIVTKPIKIYWIDHNVKFRSLCIVSQYCT